MVCALRGTNNLNVLRDDISQAWLEALRNGTKYPEEKLDSFLNLYKKIKSNKMLMYVHSNKFTQTLNQGKNVKILNNLRNEFIHFTPKGWSLEVSTLPQIVVDCINIIEFLAFQSNNIIYSDTLIELRIKDLLIDIRNSLDDVNIYYNT